VVNSVVVTTAPAPLWQPLQGVVRVGNAAALVANATIATNALAASIARSLSLMDT
jgi:hypothetical protein